MPKRPMLPEDVSLLHWATDTHLSPDGGQVAWTEISFDEEADRPVSRIMTAPADGGEEPRSFTEGPADFQPRFSPDGRYLAYLSADGGPPSLRVAPLAGGAPRKIEAPGPVSFLTWAPAGDRLAIVASIGGRAPDDSPKAHNAPVVVRGLFSRLDGAGYRSGRNHVFVVDLASGSARQVTRGDYDHASPAFSPDGERLVFVSDRGRGHDDRLGCDDLWCASLSGGRLVRVTKGVGSAGYPAFSPDGDKVAFSGVLRAGEMFHRDGRVLVVDASGKGAPEVLAEGLDRPAALALGPGIPLAWAGGDELVFNVVDHGAVGIVRARLGSRGARQVVAGDRQCLGLAVAGGGRHQVLAYESTWVDQPSEIFVTALSGGKDPVRVSRTSESLSGPVELVPATRQSARAADGLEIEYFLMSPPAGGQARPRPTKGGGSRRRAAAPAPPLLVEIHGGPSLYNPICQLLTTYQALAGAGYALVLPNPRGSIGYGEEFTRLAMQDWGTADLGDLLACADDAVARGFGDEKRQFVSGYSYGGFMTSWTIGHTGRFRAAIVGAPVVDHSSMFGTTDIPWFSAAHIGGDPWAASEAFRFRSPLTYVRDVTTPVLVHVNEGDLRCPPGQADQLYSALKWLGKEVEYVRYPGGSHLSTFPMFGGAPSQASDRVSRFVDFLGRHGGVKRR